VRRVDCSKFSDPQPRNYISKIFNIYQANPARDVIFIPVLVAPKLFPHLYCCEIVCKLHIVDLSVVEYVAVLSHKFDQYVDIC